MRKSLAISVLLLTASCCLRAQDQERKLVDRLLRPDMALQSSEQKKKFIADGTSINKKASVGTFYVQKKSNSKTFSGTRELSTQQFNSQSFRGNRSALESSSHQPIGNSRVAYPTQTARSTRDAPQSDKKVPSRAYAGNRPFLDQGKSQKSLNRQNAPLTIDQVRELLNKKQVARKLAALLLIMQPDEALALLSKGAAQIINEEELREKLALDRPLRVKLGVDPTTSDIHLGHTIVLRKLRQFQDLGHQAILIIGDFTGMIGDPSGRSVTRPQLTHDEVQANAATYREQAFKILDSARTEIVCNGDWFRGMSFEDVIRLNSRVTLQQMLQREDFKTRIDSQQSIRAHEIQYPIMQGWDSVMVKADVELGGTDQLFNILIGRDFQKEEGLPQQVVFLLPILEGVDGFRKMSKSLGNFIAIQEPAVEMFGKLMSISDDLMARYYKLLLGRPPLAELHPLEAKKQLAFEIVQTYHSAAAAKKTLDEWNTRFSMRDLEHADLPVFSATPETGLAPVALVSKVYWEIFNLEKSHSEVSRLIKQGSVEIDGVKIRDPKTTVSLKPGQTLRLDRKHAVRIR